MPRANANILLRPFLLVAGNEQVCRETARLKFKTKASLLVSMNFSLLGLWFDNVPGERVGFLVWGRTCDLDGIGFWFFWKVPLAGWGWTEDCKASS